LGVIDLPFAQAIAFFDLSGIFLYFSFPEILPKEYASNKLFEFFFLLIGQLLGLLEHIFLPDLFLNFDSNPQPYSHNNLYLADVD